LAGWRHIKELTRLAISLLIVVEAAMAQQLALSLDSIVDIHELGIFALGGAEFDDESGRLWISGTGILTDAVFEIDPTTGHVFSSFSGSIVPGLKHPTAIAMDPLSANLFVYGATEAAAEVSTSGALLHMVSSHRIGAAAMDKNGRLYVQDHLPAGGDGAIHRVDKATGAFENTITINGYTGTISSMDFDPISGNLFVYADEDDTLLEIDIVSGDILSVTSLTEFLLAAEYPVVAPFPFIVMAAFAFNEDGTELYLSRGWNIFTSPYGGETLIVINRELPPCGDEVDFEDLGNALPGALGVAPQLVGEEAQRLSENRPLAVAADDSRGFGGEAGSERDAVKARASEATRTRGSSPRTGAGGRSPTRAGPF
jgi:WD40 repeat protein